MAVLDVNEVVQALHAVRNEWRDAQRRSREPGGRELPSRDALAQIVEQLKGALFPMRLGPPELRLEARTSSSRTSSTPPCRRCWRRPRWNGA